MSNKVFNLEDFLVEGEQENTKNFLSLEKAKELVNDYDLDDSSKDSILNLYEHILTMARDSFLTQQKFVQLQDSYNNLLRHIETLQDTARVNRNNLFSNNG